MSEVKAGRKFTLKTRGAGGRVLDQTKVTVKEVRAAGRGHAVLYIADGETTVQSTTMGTFLKRAA
ncbi:hypothetical protein A7A76_07630 [Lysobacter enzymogenes]|uniref:hypothetical protein n=1 Tax=Lysobacter enzymogenes TaxID=69 RepID=UPI0019D2F733|nr:hypothetical protein [Lysobacter enzymogenes]MBN7138963.1 hypothetical protein [Lysobacter enzymogenes]